MKSDIIYDIIGDIHGRRYKLVNLLRSLGYECDEGFYCYAPPGRRAVFLGDLIDPKPGHDMDGGVWATLEIVKRMCDRGDAICLMGNHELNAIYYHSKGPDGRWLRVHGSKNKAMHQGTLNDYTDYEDPEGEWQQIWIPWMKKLPFYADLGGFRVVHATWHQGMIDRIAGRSLEDPDFFLAAADKHTPEGEALEILLKGVEIDLPAGVSYMDHTGNERRRSRVCWWEKPGQGIGYDRLAFPENPRLPAEPVGEDAFEQIPGYPDDAPPVFFGHYLKAADAPLLPERHNVACLDHSGATDGPLVAYCWQGESEIKPEHYVAPHYVEKPLKRICSAGEWRLHLIESQRREERCYQRMKAHGREVLIMMGYDPETGLRRADGS